MARASKKPGADNQQQAQDDMFPTVPRVMALAVTGFTLKGGELSASMTGVANVNDVARLTDDAWRDGAARWFLGLCGGDSALAVSMIERIVAEIEARENVVVEFPGFGPGPGQ